MSGWLPDPRGVCPGGDVGGDIQAAESWAVRFLNLALPEACITVWVYPAGSETGDGEDWHTPPFRVQVATEYSICDDPQDPGGTEHWSDTRFADEPGVYPALRYAEKEAIRLARAYAAGGRLPDRDWDGEVFR